MKGERHFAALLLVYILPNAVLFLIAKALGVGRPLLNVDYAVAVVLLVFGWRYLAIVLIAVFLCADVLVLFGQVMPFVRLDDLFYLLRFSAMASDYHLMLLVSSLCLLLLLGIVIYFESRHVSKLVSLVLLNVMLFFSFFQPAPRAVATERFYSLPAYWWSKSQTLIFFKVRGSAFLQAFDDEGVALKRSDASSASMPFEIDNVHGAVSERVMLVVAESWGQTVDSRIREKLLEPLTALPSRLIEQGEVLSTGWTLAGELRELCHLVPIHYNLKPVTEGFEHCLPNQLRSLGYRTLSLHGATGLMYDRIYWYPRVGFERSIFFESRLWPRRCYSFPGACDADLFEQVRSFFQGSGRRFLYWLTLNSHAPYDERDISGSYFNCLSFSIEPSSEVCRNLMLQAQFFNGLAGLMRDEAMSGVQVVVVGDHPPVMIDGEQKNKYFLNDRVPWVYVR